MKRSDAVVALALVVRTLTQQRGRRTGLACDLFLALFAPAGASRAK